MHFSYIIFIIFLISPLERKNFLMSKANLEIQERVLFNNRFQFEVFFFFYCEQKKTSQRKRKNASFLRLYFVQPFKPVRLRRISYTRQTLRFAPFDARIKQKSNVYRNTIGWLNMSEILLIPRNNVLATMAKGYKIISRSWALCTTNKLQN